MGNQNECCAARSNSFCAGDRDNNIILDEDAGDDLFEQKEKNEFSKRRNIHRNDSTKYDEDGSQTDGEFAEMKKGLK